MEDRIQEGQSLCDEIILHNVTGVQVRLTREVHWELRGFFFFFLI